jgi:hypothetical protein
MDSITVGLNGMLPSQAARTLGDASQSNKRLGRYNGHEAAVFLGLPETRTFRPSTQENAMTDGDLGGTIDRAAGAARLS